MQSDRSGVLAVQRFDGRYSDGKSAGSLKVDVRLSERGIAINAGSGEELGVWPYADLRVAEPLRKNSIDALVSTRAHEGATLFVTGRPFASALGELAPQLSASAERWRNFHPWLVAATVLVGLAAVIHFANLRPATFIAAAIPDDVRHNLGKQSVAAMTGDRGTCVAPDGLAALDRLVARLSGTKPRASEFSVTVADWPILNAFATPGENIVLTRGLITRAKSPDELAGVLAHEMGHGISRHPEAGIVRAVGLAAIFELLSGGGGSTIGNLGMILAQVSYTRDAEREADDHALRILKRAKVSPQGLERFFRRISTRAAAKKNKGNEGDSKPQKRHWTRSLEVLSTHPFPAERAERVHRQAAYDSTPAMSESDWTDLKKICAETLGGKKSMQAEQPSSGPSDANSDDREDSGKSDVGAE